MRVAGWVKFSVVTAEYRKKVSKVNRTRNRTTGISFSNVKKTSKRSEFKAEIAKEWKVISSRGEMTWR